MELTVESAYQELDVLIDTPEQEQALNYLANLAKKADAPSSKQLWALGKEAEKQGVDLEALISNLTNGQLTSPTELNKKQASHLIGKLKERAKNL